jgi:hypothetical protein
MSRQRLPTFRRFTSTASSARRGRIGQGARAAAAAEPRAAAFRRRAATFMDRNCRSAPTDKNQTRFALLLCSNSLMSGKPDSLTPARHTPPIWRVRRKSGTRSGRCDPRVLAETPWSLRWGRPTQVSRRTIVPRNRSCFDTSEKTDDLTRRHGAERPVDKLPVVTGQLHRPVGRSPGMKVAGLATVMPSTRVAASGPSAEFVS